MAKKKKMGVSGYYEPFSSWNSSKEYQNMYWNMQKGGRGIPQMYMSMDIPMANAVGKKGMKAPRVGTAPKKVSR